MPILPGIISYKTQRVNNIYDSLESHSIIVMGLNSIAFFSRLSFKANLLLQHMVPSITSLKDELIFSHTSLYLAKGANELRNIIE